MRRTLLIVLLVAIALTILVPGRVLAADGRDFAGFYQTGEVTELGEHVEVELVVRVFNYSDADVLGASIVLEDSSLPGRALGSFLQTVDIRERESVRATSTFIIPRPEYERWQDGATPPLRLELADAAGTTRLAPIELAPMLFDGEN